VQSRCELWRFGWPSADVFPTVLVVIAGIGVALLELIA
jgi:hypothetical protein